MKIRHCLLSELPILSPLINVLLLFLILNKKKFGYLREI